MKLVLKRVVGWDRRTEAEKVMLRHRLQSIRYRLLYLASHVLSLLPIPLVLILRICGSDKHQLHASTSIARVGAALPANATVIGGPVTPHFGIEAEIADQFLR
jgi:hypothetical protein